MTEPDWKARMTEYDAIHGHERVSYSTDRATEQKPIATGLYLSRKEYAALYSRCNSPLSEDKLDAAMRHYRATCSWINECYDGKQREVLFRGVRPCEYDYSNDLLMSSELEDVIQESYAPKKDDPDAWQLAFDGSHKAVECYLRCPTEFQNKKTDTFFVRYAIKAVLKSIKALNLSFWGTIGPSLILPFIDIVIYHRPFFSHSGRKSCPLAQ